MAPRLVKEYLKNSSENCGSRFYNFAIEIDCLGKHAHDFVNVISELTGIDSISNLTLIPLVSNTSRQNKPNI